MFIAAYLAEQANITMNNPQHRINKDDISAPEDVLVRKKNHSKVLVSLFFPVCFLMRFLFKQYAFVFI